MSILPSFFSFSFDVSRNYFLISRACEMDVNGDKLLKEVVRARRLQGEILDHVPDRMDNNACPLSQLKVRCSQTSR